MSLRLVKYHEQRCTEASTSCYDILLLASDLWDAIEVGMPTARMESHRLCLARARGGGKDSEAGEHLWKTTRCAGSCSFIEWTIQDHVDRM